MTTANAAPGADQLYLLIEPNALVVRCHTHPQFSETHPYGPDERTVPATGVVESMLKHLQEHTTAPEAPAEEGATPTTETSVGLDAFAREVAFRCRWAMDANEGDPDDKWPINYRLAVALVLGNLTYLRDMGPGPGYSAQEAAVLLVRGMANRPQDLDAWVEVIRREIRRPGDQSKQGILLLPSTIRPAGT